ncbi:hypothetical protein EVAR_50919_1 [Eumeta japonica]|uniref:Uncharacterized protein n=1 Tax=Eumeta variegata TaxID=151549 RepID=A0A4C1Y2H6_EUMVA|nr:hypothetical protein EVAR_50919_1 [Eumeta japonica]
MQAITNIITTNIDMTVRQVELASSTVISVADAVSSSGYRSPNGGGAVISLDSPSPPAPSSPAAAPAPSTTVATTTTPLAASTATITRVERQPTPVDNCTSGNGSVGEREDSEATPAAWAHWAPYADSHPDRDNHEAYKREKSGRPAPTSGHSDDEEHEMSPPAQSVSDRAVKGSASTFKQENRVSPDPSESANKLSAQVKSYTRSLLGKMSSPPDPRRR